MHIQVNTDENIEGSEDLTALVSAEIRSRLDRYSEHITRIGPTSAASSKRASKGDSRKSRATRLPRSKGPIRGLPESCSASLSRASANVAT